MKRLLLIVAGAAGLLGADLNGKWNFIWQTPGKASGAARSSFKQNAENVEAHFPDGEGTSSRHFQRRKAVTLRA